MKEFKLPNFLIIGAAKSGTTSIHNYISQHPEVFMSSVKEPHFFADIPKGTKGGNYASHAINDLEQYKDLFKGVSEQSLIGESSVTSLYYPNAIKKATELLGSSIKVLIVLRNPVDRAYSNYMHHVRDCNEDLSFFEALEKEEERIKENYWWGYHLKKAGIYSSQIENIYKYLPEGNVKILLFDDLNANNEKFMKEVCLFLGVSESFEFNTNEVSNKSGKPKFPLLKKFILNNNILRKTMLFFLNDKVKNKLREKVFSVEKTKISIEDRSYLKSYYKEEILKLEKLINKDLSIWLN